MNHDNKSHNYDKLFGESIKIISNCPSCGLPYNSLEAKLLNEKDEVRLIYIRCHHCLSSLVALITLNIYGINSLGLITDLDGPEVNGLSEKKPLTSQEIIDSYELLKNSSGLIKLLTKNDF